MAAALVEVARVLKPGGVLYVSEPMARGPFDKIMRTMDDGSMPDLTSDTLDRIHDRIAEAAPGGVWSRADFLDIAPPTPSKRRCSA